MSLLLDQNISPRIIKHLSSEFPEAKHVRQVELEDASDLKIFEFAKKNNLSIVTFDSEIDDFFEELTAKGVKIVEGIVLRPFGSREFVIKDSDGRKVLVGD